MEVGGGGRRTQIMLRASMRMLGTISTISSSATNSTCSTDTTSPKIGLHRTSLPFDEDSFCLWSVEGKGLVTSEGEKMERCGSDCPAMNVRRRNTRTWLAPGLGREREMEALRVRGGEARAEIDEDESETARRGEEAAGRCASLNYSPIRGPKSPSNNRAQQPLHAASVRFGIVAAAHRHRADGGG